MRTDSALAILEGLFSANHEPVFDPPKRVQHRTLPVEFPTRKCPAGGVRCRSPLMADGLLHLDTDPNVLAISPYPLIASTWVEIEPGVEDRLEHFADVAIRRRDSSVVFLKYESYEIQKERPWLENKARVLADYYRDVLGCAYRVLNETSLRIEPRLSNLRTMWQHREVRSQPSQLDRVRDALLAHPTPVSIHTLWEDVGRPALAIWWEGDSTPTHLSGPNPVFTAVMQLAMLGEVRLDLGQPLSMQSLVTRV